MTRLRKVFVGLLSLILLISLLGAAFSTSADQALTHPAKLESWLNQSGFYSSFVTNAITQAKKSANSSEGQGSVTLSDSAVAAAAQAAFSTPLLQSSVKTVLNANYAWLQGQTASPSFAINLTQAKQSFAAQVGQYVQAHLASLPTCTPQQLVALGNLESIDPLNVACRPAGLSPQAEAALVTQRVNTNGDFLKNTLITPSNLSINGAAQTQPYYQKLAKAPRLYRLATNLPWIAAGIAALSTLAIVFLSPRKRRGLRRVAVILALSGLILGATKFIADALLKQLDKRLLSSASLVQLQQSLTDFLHRIEQQLVKVDLWFGVGYLALALVIFLILIASRRRQLKPAVNNQPLDRAAGEPPQENASPSAPESSPSPDRPTPTGAPPRPKQPPRLIQ